MDGRMNESLPVAVFYRTLSPLGPLPCFPSLQFTITQSRAMGIADHILPLGDLFVFWAARLKFQPQGSNPILKASIPATKLKSVMRLK